MKTLVPPDAINGKSFLIEPAGTDAWQVTVHRHGLIEETIPAATRAEACRLARRLSDSGLVGLITEDPPWTTYPPTSTNAVL